MRLRSILVEDEEHSMSRLRRILAGFPQDIEVIGEAIDGPSAVAAIRAQTPDLVFLDIALPGCNGFQVLDQLDKQPHVIFTTAYDQHALDAFKTHAFAYLLKPIDADHVAGALAKRRAMTEREVRDRRHLTRLRCRNGDRIVLVPVGDVHYFQADNGYTNVHTADHEYLIDTPLIDLQRDLNPNDFTRIHRATIVNISSIAEIRRGYDGKLTVVLKDASGTVLPVSRHFADNLDAIF